MTNPVGRPMKLTPELKEKATKYIVQCIDNLELTDKGALAFVEVKLPTVVGFARYLGVNKDTVYEWAKIDQEFSDIVKDILNEQEEKLINNGLGGLYTPKIVGMLLAKHGYAEKTESSVVSKTEVTIVSEKMKKLAKKLNG
jgi:hypothetical protein